MHLQDFKKLTLPPQPGIYLFKRGQEILYVGKATSLRTRLRSYFESRLLLTRGPVVQGMVTRADALEWTVTESVLEALILEAKLIKKFQPSGNAIQKDDKSFLFVTITNDPFPQVLTERGHGTYGPFTSPASLREALRIIRRIFPFNTHAPDKVIPWGAEGKRKAKPKSGDGSPGKVQPSRESHIRRGCFEYQIGLCPGSCVGAADQKEYRKTIRKIKLLFEGNKARVISELKKEMLIASKTQEYEKASKYKRQLNALEHIRDVSLIKDDAGELRRVTGYRVEAYDVAHHAGASTVGVMTVVEDGQPAKRWYRKFKIKSTAPGTVDDIQHLRELLRRRLVHLEWPLPQLIVVDGGAPQKKAAEQMLADRGFSIDVAAVLKDEKHKPKEVIATKTIGLKHGKEILLANSEAHRFAIGFHRQTHRKKFLEHKKTA